jgi:hypothetical protein
MQPKSVRCFDFAMYQILTVDDTTECDSALKAESAEWVLGWILERSILERPFLERKFLDATIPNVTIPRRDNS